MSGLHSCVKAPSAERLTAKQSIRFESAATLCPGIPSELQPVFLGKAKINEVENLALLGLPAPADEEVVRLDVAMDEIFGMEIFYPEQERTGMSQCLKTGPYEPKKVGGRTCKASAPPRG